MINLEYFGYVITSKERCKLECCILSWAGGLMILYIFVTCFCIKLCGAHCELKLGNYLFLLKLTVFLSKFWFWIWVWKSHWWRRDFQDLMLSKTTIDTSAHKENLLMFISEYYCNLTKKKITLKRNSYLLRNRSSWRVSSWASEKVNRIILRLCVHCIHDTYLNGRKGRALLSGMSCHPTTSVTVISEKSHANGMISTK